MNNRDQLLIESIGQTKFDSINEDQRNILSTYYSPIDLKKMSLQNETQFTRTLQNITFGILKHKLTHVSEEEYAELLDWYKENSTEVNEITCDKCHKMGAIELEMKDYNSNEFFGAKSIKRHPDGRFIVWIGSHFLSSRCRLDAEIGLECICGNDTRWSAEELEVIPMKSVLSQLSMQDLQAFKQYEDVNGRKNYRKELKNGNLLVDNFEFKKVK